MRQCLENESPQTDAFSGYGAETQLQASWIWTSRRSGCSASLTSHGSGPCWSELGNGTRAHDQAAAPTHERKIKGKWTGQSSPAGRRSYFRVAPVQLCQGGFPGLISDTGAVTAGRLLSWRMTSCCWPLDVARSAPCCPTAEPMMSFILYIPI